jgi:uncharacterized protein
MASAPRRVPAHAVAALYLERQHLDRPRGRRLTAKSLTRFVEDAGGIQLDTINVVERAHRLTAWSRFDVHDFKTFDRLAYGKRLLYEYWAHAACLVPRSDVGMWRHVMDSLRWTGRGPSWERWVRKHAKVLAEVEAAISARGPLASADFEDEKAGKRGGWWDRKPATHALDYLWMSGRTAVHSRVNFQKRFDLLERVMPDGLGEELPDEDAFWRWHLRRSLHAMGAGTAADLRMYLSFPSAPEHRRKALKEALREGEVIEVTVETPGRPVPWLVLARDLDALARAGARRTPSRGTALLSPFDSFLWHRDRVRRLFGYDYTIEVYVPAPKRKHGYYSLPIFHDGHVVGRLDPKTHRSERRLELKSVHFEPWFAAGRASPGALRARIDRDATLAGVSEAIASLARFVGADDVSLGRVTPATMGPPLRRALRATRMSSGKEVA